MNILIEFVLPQCIALGWRWCRLSSKNDKLLLDSPGDCVTNNKIFVQRESGAQFTTQLMYQSQQTAL